MVRHNFRHAPPVPVVVYIDTLGILIPLLAFRRQFPAHLHASFRDRDAEVGYSIEPWSDELAFFGHVLILVVKKIADIGPL